MRSSTFLGALAFSAFAGVVPVDALTINGVDYVLFGKTHVKIEDGPASITGNVAVNDPGGLLRIGAFNEILGAATADRMFFGTGSRIATCEFNTSTGGNPVAACDNLPPDLNPSGATVPITAWPPLPVPPIPDCVATNPDLNVPAGGSATPVPGCYGDVRVHNNATLTLSPGTYNFKALRLETGSLLGGSGAAVNVKGSIVTEPGVTISDVNLTSVNTGSFEAIVIGNSSSVSNSVLYAPNARMHLHQGGNYTNFEFVAVFITVEPVQVVVADGCACIGAIATSGQTIQLSGGCNLGLPAHEFFVSTTCAIDPYVSCPGANCVATTAQGGATSATATLNIPAAPPGNYHVIVRSLGGAFCTAATVPLP